jgi:hypothetical protein
MTEQIIQPKKNRSEADLPWPDPSGEPIDSPLPAACQSRFWSTPGLAGEDYMIVLRRLHATFNPQTYMEIGVSRGESLELANCFSIAIDPKFTIERPRLGNKPACCFFNMTSDRFFQRFDPTTIFGQPIDMAFLGGLHLFEFLLRDFINVERHCKMNSIIVLHDCVPTDEYVCRRDINDHKLKEQSAHPEWWAGDVWKVADILLSFRPDLRLVVFDAVPTGLIAVTSLDPSSTLLRDRYFSLVEAYKGKTLIEDGDAYYRSLNLFETRRYASFEALSTLFWL